MEKESEMTVKELIAALLNEDMDAPIYVRFEMLEKDEFHPVDGLATNFEAYHQSPRGYAPTLLLES